MENEWKMVVGGTTYTMEMIEEKAASGVSLRNFMDTIEPQREMDLIYGGVMKERIILGRHIYSQCWDRREHGQKTSDGYHSGILQ